MVKDTAKSIGDVPRTVFDSGNNILKKQNQFYRVKMLEIHHDESNIYGMFPFFDNHLDDELRKSPAYTTFTNKHKPQLKIFTNSRAVSEVVEFGPGESIESVIAFYNEDEKKVTAIKLKTNKKSSIFGKKSDINSGKCTSISKASSFITGFKTGYMIDNNVPYLSFLFAHFDDNDNYQEYFKQKEPTEFELQMKRFRATVSSISSKIFKLLVTLMTISFPFLYALFSIYNFNSGEVRLDRNVFSLDGDLKILTDENGYSHIKAESKKDAFFGLGFAQAKERLWQMDLLRRITSGRLSEMFGPKALPSDKLMISLGYRSMVDKFESNMAEDKEGIIDSYVAGINSFAENHILPIEYYITFNSFEPWTKKDILNISQLMSHGLTADYQTQMWYTIIKEKMGSGFADYLVKNYLGGFDLAENTILNDKEIESLGLHRGKTKDAKYTAENIANKYMKKEETEEKKEEKKEETPKKEVKKEVKKEEKKEEAPKKEQKKKEAKKPAPKRERENDPKVHIEKDEMELDIPAPVEGASNSWVVSGKYTESGMPILSNDPHLNNSTPSIHFVAKLYIKDFILNGSFAAGTPLPISGSNNFIAWGVTSENTAIADMCEEKIDGDNYIFEGKKYPLRIEKHEIKVKGQDSETMFVRYTRNGPLVEPFHSKATLFGFSFKHYAPTSFRIVNKEEDMNSLEAFKAVMFAESIKDFMEARHLLTHINLNYILAEKKTGDIAYTPVGVFPIRKSYYNGFCEGWSEDHQILRRRYPEAVPKLVNPEKGFIVTANNKMASDNYKETQKGFWYFYRAARIREMIEEKIKDGKKMSVKDHQEIMFDVLDVHARYVLPKFLEVAKKHIKEQNMYIEALSKWDFNMAGEKVEPLIWSVLEMNISKSLFTSRFTDDEAKGLASLMTFYNAIETMAKEMSEGKKVELKECALVTGEMDCEMLIVHVFNNLDELMKPYKNYKGGFIGWEYHKRKEYPHLPFNSMPILRNLFNHSTYAAGSRNTVNVAKGLFNAPEGEFVAKHTANLRFVCDLADITQPLISTDTGNSGHIFNRFYSNMFYLHSDNQMVHFTNKDFKGEHAELNTILVRNQ